jgi:enoyl-CoA hydratase
MVARCEINGATARVTISNPGKLNALDLDTIHDLIEAWRQIESDDHVRLCILTGEGDQAFSAGADLKTLLPKLTAGGLYDEIIGPDAPAFLKRVSGKPVIAAVRGHCIAGGMELLLGTDIRVASEDARFGIPEAKWGLFPAGGTPTRLPGQIPFCWAMEILLTGDSIDAETALRIGLINRCVPAELVEPTVDELAQKILRNGPMSVQKIKETVLRSRGLSLRDGYATEAVAARAVFSSEDAVEGPKAFTEKRPPVFHGR